VVPDSVVWLFEAQSELVADPPRPCPSPFKLIAIWRSVCSCIAFEYEVTVVLGSRDEFIVLVELSELTVPFLVGHIDLEPSVGFWDTGTGSGCITS
jgi:hypothetical protein